MERSISDQAFPVFCPTFLDVVFSRDSKGFSFGSNDNDIGYNEGLTQRVCEGVMMMLGVLRECLQRIFDDNVLLE
jgi:hypothetical protein